MEKIEPYWHKNKDWYYWDKEKRKFKLTNKAPQKAIDSYNEYYKERSKETI